MDSKTLSKAALLAALSIIFGYIEQLLPLPLPVNGAKIGISNIVILISLYIMPFGVSWGILAVKISVSSLLFSGFSAFLYSAAGGALSLLGMWIFKKSDKFGIIGISVVGGILHNIGQLLCARLILSTINVWIYLAPLILFGTLCGVIIGIMSDIVLKKLNVK